MNKCSSSKDVKTDNIAGLQMGKSCDGREMDENSLGILRLLTAHILNESAVGDGDTISSEFLA